MLPAAGRVAASWLLLAPTPLAARSSNLPRPEAGRTGILGGSRCG
jgi:hypothetical protein